MKRWILIACILMGCAPALAPAGRSQDLAEESAGVFRHLHFRDLGPAVAGGRVTVVLGIPGNPHIYYVGAAGGGVWKTTNGGGSWKAVFAHDGSASIGAIALAPSDPNLVWVGTGEANPRNDVIDGAGLYFSPDGGHDWKRMGFAAAGQISSILVDPHDANTVFVGVLGNVWKRNAERGVFKTTDGGKTWTKVLFVNDSTGVSDIVMAPDNPQVLFAGMWQVRRYPWMLDDGGPGSGIYRSTDGGQTWTKLTKGLPKGLLGRIALAIAPSNPDHLYALVEAKHGLLWQSLDMGDRWTAVSDNHALDIRPFYFSRAFVAPNDENRLYFCSFQLMESDDGGRTARPIDRGVHVDHHALWIDPTDPERMIQGNDGGVWLTRDDGKHWRILDGMPIEEDYALGVSTQVPYVLCAGLQDNDAWCGNREHGWYVVTGGDGQYAVPAPSDPSIVYTDAQNGWISRVDLVKHTQWSVRPYLVHVNGKSPADMKYRFNWTAPIAVSPTDANEVYLGANVLFRSTDGGRDWSPISPDLTRNDKSKQVISGGPIAHEISGEETYDTILSITIAPSDPRVIWVGSDDGLVHVTRDGGKTWTNVTANIPGAPAWTRVYHIGVSPFDPGTAYVSFDAHMLGNHHPYVYRTSNFGGTWQEIVAGLPNEPVDVVREDPNQRGLLVLGCETGLYSSTNDGDRWQEFPVTFPVVPVVDLQFVKATDDLVVATHGRGLFVLHDIRPIEEMTPAIASSDFHLFSINRAFLVDPYSRGKQGVLSRTYHLLPSPPGANIDYFLKTAIPSPAKASQRGEIGANASGKRKAPVEIIITDTAGHEVATDYGPAKAGVNRFVWNLRYDPPVPIKGAPMNDVSALFGAIHGGPLVAPGVYKVSVTAGDQTQTQNVTILADPSVKAVPAAFQQEVAFALDARDMLNAVDEIINRIDDLQSQVAAFAHAATPSSHQPPAPRYQILLAAGKTLHEKLEKAEQTVYNTRVRRLVPEDEVHYLADLHSQVKALLDDGWIGYGQPPSCPAREEMAALRLQLERQVGAFNQLLKIQVARYNRLAQQSNAPTLFVGTPVVLPSVAGDHPQPVRCAPAVTDRKAKSTRNEMQ